MSDYMKMRQGFGVRTLKSQTSHLLHTALEPFTEEEILSGLAQEQIETALMLLTKLHENDIGFLGISANQIEALESPKQFIIVDHNGVLEVSINPKITFEKGDLVVEPEGCLSLEEEPVEVARYPKIKLSYQKVNSKDVVINKTRNLTKGDKELLARIYQHEIKHLEGKLTTD